jgi:hypothetical protein
MSLFEKKKKLDWNNMIGKIIKIVTSVLESDVMIHRVIDMNSKVYLEVSEAESLNLFYIPLDAIQYWREVKE